MAGYLTLLLHGHLPYVRHPEHERFLEESWLFEAITECYLPILGVMEDWWRDGMRPQLTLTLTPTLCSMLRDPLLTRRYAGYLSSRIELAEKEVHRTMWNSAEHGLALFYHARFIRLQGLWNQMGRDVIGAFASLQNRGLIEIITSAATHALLPLLADHPPSLRGQILTAVEHYRSCFGREPRGIWLPECAYTESIEPILREANIRWFILDTHGLLHAKPRPRYGVFAPVFTPTGLAAFGRDLDSAKQVWSRQEGYPGDPLYRDFYRDIGFDLDLDYVQPYLPSRENRGFTGLKYSRITGRGGAKEIYSREAAVEKAAQHAGHFLEARLRHFDEINRVMDKPPILVCPYDAELFGHWWFEGPEFLDFLVRKIWYDQSTFQLITPGEYLRRESTHQIAQPALSSWGEEGYWQVWLNETNQWILPHLRIAQDRMTDMIERHPNPDGLASRALNQAARELMLAQASDWPFILKAGTSSEYARFRVKSHLLRFIALHEQLTTTRIDEAWLKSVEAADNIFPEVNYRHWRAFPG